MVEGNYSEYHVISLKYRASTVLELLKTLYQWQQFELEFHESNHFNVLFVEAELLMMEHTKQQEFKQYFFFKKIPNDSNTWLHLKFFIAWNIRNSRNCVIGIVLSCVKRKKVSCEIVKESLLQRWCRRNGNNECQTHRNQSN